MSRIQVILAMVDHLETSSNWSFVVFEKVVNSSHYFGEFGSRGDESEGRLRAAEFGVDLFLSSYL